MKKRYYVIVNSVENICGTITDKIREEFYFESYFDAFDKFESLVGLYVFNGFITGTFSNDLLDTIEFSRHRVSITNKYTTYHISFYDFKKFKK